MESDLGLCPKNPRFFGKNRVKLFLKSDVHDKLRLSFQKAAYPAYSTRRAATNLERFRYLSHRAALLFLGAGALVLAALCGWLFCALGAGAGLGGVVLAALAALGLGLVLWLWVLRPYRALERWVQLFLEGRAPSQDAGMGATALSPTGEGVLRQMHEVLNPSQLFNLNKGQAQYLALQNQINPHFLYNTLESIRSECLIARLDSVADMTEALASFFRYTISKVENLVSVEEELQNCATYFRIQQYRFEDRLTLRVECDEGDREEIYRCRLPKLTLQPILENSIIHGTELKVGVGNLTIRLERTGKRLLIQISDDGVGMDEATLAQLNARLNRGGLAARRTEGKQRGGLALPNVSSRVRLLFGEEYGLHVFSHPGVGTDVELTLPAITSDREVQNREALL